MGGRTIELIRILRENLFCVYYQRMEIDGHRTKDEIVQVGYEDRIFTHGNSVQK